MVIPEGTMNRILWALTLPIHAACKATTPDCRKEKHKEKYTITFLMSMIWISFYSYIMVWMITVIGTKSKAVILLRFIVHFLLKRTIFLMLFCEIRKTIFDFQEALWASLTQSWD